MTVFINRPDGILVPVFRNTDQEIQLSCALVDRDQFDSFPGKFFQDTNICIAGFCCLFTCHCDQGKSLPDTDKIGMQDIADLSK